MTPAPTPETGDDAQANAGGQQQQQAQAQPSDPHEVCISKGRTVRLREATIADEEEVARLLADLGHNVAQAAPTTMMRSAALYTIASINGGEVRPPRNAAEFRTFQLLFTPGDGLKLAMAYVKLNGLDDESFRDAG